MSGSQILLAGPRTSLRPPLTPQLDTPIKHPKNTHIETPREDLGPKRDSVVFPLKASSGPLRRARPLEDW